ncbi:MAG: diaminopimelate epimerase [Bacteroidetes bacterium]|nr:diaminopimelate epimerase [Bacteroidota bacterium]
MQIPFVKYHGTGNDFILVDDRMNTFTYSTELISQLCDRHFGIGADGLLILRNCPEAAFEMLYFNSDGSHATFCGNGGRCIVAFARDLGIIEKQCVFKAPDGKHQAYINETTASLALVKLQMQNAILYKSSEDHIFLNTGTYHTVVFVDDPDQVDVVKEGQKIRNDAKYKPQGTNVNFACIHGDEMYVRTYEKGVENETLSCGTGVTASAIAASLRYGGTNWKIHTRGGDLKVSFDIENESYINVFLEGEATRVFEGLFNL